MSLENNELIYNRLALLFGKAKYNEYILPEKERLKLEKLIKKNKVTKIDLKRICNYFFEHLGVQNNYVTFKIETCNIRMTPLGTFEPMGQFGGRITFKQRITYTVDNLLCILAHECMHFYAFQKNVEYFDTYPLDLMEALTDYSAVYFGFGDIMINGYSQFISDERSKFFEDAKRYIGYVSAGNLKSFRNYITKK